MTYRECDLHVCINTRLEGVPTRHTHKWDGLHTRHLLVVHTQTHTQTQTNTQRGPTKHGVRAHPHAVAAPSSEKGACRTASCISVAISHAEGMCTTTERRCACSASHVDVDQITSFSYFTAGAAGSACSTLKPYTVPHLVPTPDLHIFSTEEASHRSGAIFLVR